MAGIKTKNAVLANNLSPLFLKKPKWFKKVPKKINPKNGIVILITLSINNNYSVLGSFRKSLFGVIVCLGFSIFKIINYWKII